MQFAKLRLNQINTLLLVLIIAINCCIIALPLVPNILFWARGRDPAVTQGLHARIAQPAPAVAGTPAPAAVKDDRLIIPSMLLDEAIHTGPTAKTLRQGLWLRPNGSTPAKGGNTVIVGHRFTYTNPQGTLYHLHKVAIGDEIGIWWQGVRHHYTVTEIKTVHADAITIEAPTPTTQLTIYTCTPLWLPKDRLVVIAREDT